MAEHEYRFAGALGETRAVGGFATPDCIVDFPELIRNLRRAAELDGVEFHDGVAADTLEIRDRSVREVHLSNGTSVPCDFCVIAMGAWTKPFLTKHRTELPIALKKCIVLRYEGELVPCLTVCLDIRERKGPDAALAPFKGTTIAAESWGETADDPDDLSVDAGRVELLIEEYGRCFPALRDHEPKPVVCFKTEQQSRSGVDLDCHAYDLPDIENTIVAIPGKASLMFVLGGEVAARVRDLTRRCT